MARPTPRNSRASREAMGQDEGAARSPQEEVSHMESILLDTPSGIGARLGWDPKVTEHDRKRILARQLVAARLKIEEKAIKVQREAPAQFGFHTQLFAEVDGEELPLEIR